MSPRRPLRALAIAGCMWLCPATLAGAHTTPKPKPKKTVKPVVKIERLRINEEGVIAVLEISNAGTVRISGTDVKSTVRSLKAGKHTVTVIFTPIGRINFERHPRIRLAATLTLPPVITVPARTEVTVGGSPGEGA